MKKMVRALILVIVCVMMTAPGAEIQAKTKKISLVLNGRKQRTVTISNSDKKSEMKIKVSKKSGVKVKRIKKSKNRRCTAVFQCDFCLLFDYFKPAHKRS